MLKKPPGQQQELLSHTVKGTICKTVLHQGARQKHNSQKPRQKPRALFLTTLLI
jgi:hypothetical protein